MQWDEKYATGILEIDDQHKVLFMVTSRLQNAIKAGKAEAIIAQTFKELIDYTNYHFAAEEHEMNVIGYADLLAHRHFHVAIVENIKKVLLRMRNGSSYNPIELLRFLNTWLTGHILEKDQNFAKIYKQKKDSLALKPISGSQWLRGRLEKHRELKLKKLIPVDVNISEKRKIMVSFLALYEKWPESEIRDVCESLKTFVKGDLLLESEMEEFKISWVKKINIEQLLQNRSEVDSKALKMYLQDNKLLPLAEQ